MAQGTKVYLPRLGHQTKMAALPIYDKNPLNFFFCGTNVPMAMGPCMQH